MAQQPTTHRATCKWFNAKLGYGFIKRENQTDVYFQEADINGHCVLNPGTPVEFEIINLNNNRIKATNVRTKDKFSNWRRRANSDKNKSKYRHPNATNQNTTQTQEKEVTQPQIHEQNIQNEIENDTKVTETEELDETTVMQLNGAFERALVLYRGKDSNNQLPESGTGQEFVKNWLLNVFKANPHNGKNYFVKLVNEGFDDMECVTGMNDQDLKDVGIHKLGHRRKILKACEAYTKNH